MINNVPTEVINYGDTCVMVWGGSRTLIRSTVRRGSITGKTCCAIHVFNELAACAAHC